MNRKKQNTLLALVQSYFHSHLRNVRGASEHTLRAYGNALRLFFIFLAHRGRHTVEQLGLDHIQADAVLAFLDSIESERGNSRATRNCRLAAIRGFVQHILRNDISHADQYGRILAIANKRSSPRAMSYLEPEEARAIISAVDSKTRYGARDRALLLLLYNTGARISEALSIRPQEIRLDRPRQVKLHGKGGKDRYCPLGQKLPWHCVRFSPLILMPELFFETLRGYRLVETGPPI